MLGCPSVARAVMSSGYTKKVKILPEMGFELRSVDVETPCRRNFEAKNSRDFED